MAYKESALEIDSDTDVLDEEYGSEYEESFEDFDYAALGIDPITPTAAKPGSEDKVRVLAARYAAGLPLWHNEDCYDHGPLGVALSADGSIVEDEEEEEA